MRRLEPRVAAIAAFAVVALTLSGILLFGRLRYPAFPSLRDQPDPDVPGLVAWVDWEASRSCVRVMPADGSRAPRALRCGEALGGPVTWTDDGLLAVAEHGRAQPMGRLLVLDPGSGREVRTESLDAVPPVPEERLADGTHVVVESTQGRVGLYVVDPAGTRQLVAEASGPRTYHWWSVRWSPDERYLLVLDSAERLLVVRRADGLVRLLVEHAGEAAWGPDGPADSASR